LLRISRYANSQLNNPYFPGPPGVGKSTVTVAIQNFARLWQQPNSVIVAAFTHAASNNARGQTLHSAFYLPTMNGSTTLSECTPAHARILLQCRLVIVDEVGQTGRNLISLMSERLRQIHNGSTLPYGGVDVTLSLDWLQVLQIISNTKMSPPRGKRLIDPLEDDEISGIEAVRCYQATTHVYYLDVNNRYAKTH
jgi:hypothetical protein